MLVNNAGMSPIAPSSLDTTEELFGKIIAVSLKGPFRLCALFRGRISGIAAHPRQMKSPQPSGNGAPHPHDAAHRQRNIIAQQSLRGESQGIDALSSRWAAACMQMRGHVAVLRDHDQQPKSRDDALSAPDKAGVDDQNTASSRGLGLHGIIAAGTTTGGLGGDDPAACG